MFGGGGGGLELLPGFVLCSLFPLGSFGPLRFGGLWGLEDLSLEGLVSPIEVAKKLKGSRSPSKLQVPSGSHTSSLYHDLQGLGFRGLGIWNFLAQAWGLRGLGTDDLGFRI